MSEDKFCRRIVLYFSFILHYPWCWSKNLIELRGYFFLNIKKKWNCRLEVQIWIIMPHYLVIVRKVIRVLLILSWNCRSTVTSFVYDVLLMREKIKEDSIGVTTDCIHGILYVYLYTLCRRFFGPMLLKILYSFGVLLDQVMVVMFIGFLRH